MMMDNDDEDDDDKKTFAQIETASYLLLFLLILFDLLFDTQSLNPVVVTDVKSCSSKVSQQSVRKYCIEASCFVDKTRRSKHTQ